jgi:hypothetical protein
MVAIGHSSAIVLRMALGPLGEQRCQLHPTRKLDRCRSSAIEGSAEPSGGGG